MSSPLAAAPDKAPSILAPPPEGPFIDVSQEPLPPRAQLLVATLTTFFILAMVCIGLRIWAKRIKKLALRFSDYAILVAAVFATAYLTICWLVADRGGLGFPLVQVAPPQRTLTQKSFIVGWLIQSWANSFVRLSILEFIAQVFFVQKFRIVVYFFEACTVAYLVGCTITFFAICRPMKYNWEVGPEALNHCGDLSLKFLLSAIFNLVLDTSILVLPMPMLWTLQLDSRKKISLTFVFGLGIVVCFATAWRTYSVVRFSTPEAKMNFTVTVVEDALWSGLEITLGIINACLPIMPPALQRLFNVPLLRLMSFSTWRSAKPSKLSSTGASGTSGLSGIGPSWIRLGSTKGEKGDIPSRTVHSINIELGCLDQIPKGDMDSTTRLAAANPWLYQYPTTNQYPVKDSLRPRSEGVSTEQQWRVQHPGC